MAADILPGPGEGDEASAYPRAVGNARLLWQARAGGPDVDFSHLKGGLSLETTPTPRALRSFASFAQEESAPEREIRWRKARKGPQSSQIG